MNDDVSIFMLDSTPFERVTAKQFEKGLDSPNAKSSVDESLKKELQTLNQKVLELGKEASRAQEEFTAATKTLEQANAKIALLEKHVSAWKDAATTFALVCEEDLEYVDPNRWEQIQKLARKINVSLTNSN